MADWTQQELDDWTMTDAESWQALRSGRVPDRVAKGGAQVVGCLSFAAVILGALAGFAFGRNTFSMLGERAGLDRTTFTLACTAVFAIGVFVWFRSKWAKSGGVSNLTTAKVNVEVHELATDTIGDRRTFLKSSDGRRFVVTKPAPRAISGRFRVYFVDIGALGGTGKEADGTPDNFVLGLEIA